MVRAILDGRKSQTRRIVKGKWDGYVGPRCPYGQSGDLLWVREAWAQRLDRDHMSASELFAAGVREAWYWADGPGRCARTGCAGAAGRHRAARFMPRWASRLTLRITKVRVERLQEISNDDAKDEGAEDWRNGQLKPGMICHEDGARGAYAALWGSINGPGSWDLNPWVWVIEFERTQEHGQVA